MSKEEWFIGIGVIDGGQEGQAIVLREGVGHDGVGKIEMAGGAAIAGLDPEALRGELFGDDPHGMGSAFDGAFKDGLHIIACEGGADMRMETEDGDEEMDASGLKVLTFVDEDLVGSRPVLHAESPDPSRRILFLAHFEEDVNLVLMIRTHCKEMSPLTILQLAMHPGIIICDLDGASIRLLG